MNKPPSRAYQECAIGIRQIHLLIRDDRADGDEHDEIADTMDSTWYQMTEAEREAIRKLSADLYYGNR
jgi:hypothetical protein